MGCCWLAHCQLSEMSTEKEAKITHFAFRAVLSRLERFFCLDKSFIGNFEIVSYTRFIKVDILFV